MWPFQRNTPLSSWPIVRIEPGGRVHGRAFSLFINNWSCHLAEIEVFADGAINCWGFVDRDLFRQKLSQRWVVAGPKPNQEISVFQLGTTKVVDGRWHQSRGTIEAQVLAAINQLNPQMTNLVDMEGSDTEFRPGKGKVQYAKMGLPNTKPVRAAEDGGQDVLGDTVPTLLRTPAGFEVSNIFVFADDLYRIGTSANLISLNAVEAMFKANELTGEAPAGARLLFPGLGAATLGEQQFGGIQNSDRLAELRDKLRVLQGHPSAIQVCMQAWEAYERLPVPDNREALRIAYENVPPHWRMFCGNMDSKDWPIRRVLYPDEKDEPL